MNQEAFFLKKAMNSFAVQHPRIEKGLFPQAHTAIATKGKIHLSLIDFFHH